MININYQNSSIGNNEEERENKLPYSKPRTEVLLMETETTILSMSSPTVTIPDVEGEDWTEE